MDIIIEILGKERLQVFALWLVLSYGVVLCSVLIDMCAAFIRCKRSKIPWVSWKQKETATKAEKYFLPMLALSIVDILVLTITQYPIFTLLIGAVNALTEWISIFEKSHSKKEQTEYAQILQTIISNKDEIGQILFNVINKKGEGDNDNK